MKLDDYDKEPNYYAMGYSIHYDQWPKSFIFESTAVLVRLLILHMQMVR